MASGERGPDPAPAGTPPGQQIEKVSGHGVGSSRGPRARSEGFRRCTPPRRRRHSAAANAAFDRTLAPGAEFFRRRLQRAMAIPPDQRYPEVHAFVASVQLMQVADELLPLTAAGEPALPVDRLAGQQAGLQAMLLAATAFHIVPEEPEWEGRPMNRLGSYVQRRCCLSRDSRAALHRPALQPLAGLLLRHIEGTLEDDPQQALQLLTDALSELIQLSASSRTALSRQLQQAQRGSQLLLLDTAEQLEAAILMQMQRPFMGTLSSLADLWDDQPPGQLDPGLLATCLAAARTSCEGLLELEPNNPKACMLASGIHSTAADLAHVVGTPAGEPSSRMLSQRSMDLQLRTFHTAKAQGSAYWTVYAAIPPVIVATTQQNVVQI